MCEKSRIEAVEAKLKKLEHELGIQKDIEEIRRLHHTYVYYNSNKMAKQVIDLVAEKAESIEIAGRGEGRRCDRENPVKWAFHETPVVDAHL